MNGLFVIAFLVLIIALLTKRATKIIKEVLTDIR